MKTTVMESQPQNPEFKNNPDNFHPSTHSYHCRRVMHNSMLIYVEVTNMKSMLRSSGHTDEWMTQSAWSRCDKGPFVKRLR